MSIVHIAFYPSDWLAGTRGMTDTETGVYITLICRMYEMAAPIERNDDRLARLCGCKSKSAFVKTLEYLISEGKVTTTDQGLFNDRVQKEIEKVTEKSSKAKQAAQSRWDKKPSKNNLDPHADASPKHMPQTCQSEPEPEPDKERGVTNVTLDDSDKNFDDFWEAYPHRNGKKNKVGAKKSFLRALKRGVTIETIAQGVEDAQRDPDVIRGYARDPATWLNQSGWTDEIPDTPINGVRENGRTNQNQQDRRVDPALERIARLAQLR